jgi:hypothetical protein
VVIFIGQFGLGAHSDHGADVSYSRKSGLNAGVRSSAESDPYQTFLPASGENQTLESPRGAGSAASRFDDTRHLIVFTS